MLDRTEYENFWYALQQKLDKILDERNMTYRGLSIELGKSPGYIHDVFNRRIDPSTIPSFKGKNHPLREKHTKFLGFNR